MERHDDGIRLGLLVMTEPLMGHREAQSLLQLARYLDQTGFDALFFVDHFFLEGDRYLAEPRDVEQPYQLECFTTMAMAAAVTERLRVGSLVTPLPLRHPSFVAKMVANIDVFSGGRTILSVGAGWNPREYEAYSFPFEAKFSRRLTKLGEGVEILRALWSDDGPVSYDGEHYTLREAPLYPKPVQRPGPPIWFGGSGAKTLELVGRYADAWTPAAPHYNAVGPEVYASGLATVRQHARNHGRDPDDILPAVLLNTSIATTREQAWEQARAQQLRDDWKDISLEDMQESGVLAVGTPEDCVAHLRRYIDAGARYLTVCPVPMTMEAARETARLYADEVIPAL
jgi:probable F420-dependent oxidoreductase